MSSILSALKRLESESQSAADRPAPAWLAQPEVRPERLAALRMTGLRAGGRWLLAVLVVAAVTATGAVIWVGRGVNPSKGDPRPAMTRKAPAPATRPAVSQAVKSTPVESTASKNPVAGPAANLRPPAKAIAPPPVMPWAQKPAEPAPPEPVGGSSPPSDEPFPLRLAEDSGLDLQAISWSEQAEKRLAVVNGRILRTGDIVEGYVVERIDSETLTLSRSGSVYRLSFHPRR